jgi:hypothetical protein
VIEKLLSDPHLLHQTADDESELPEPPIAVCTDASGLIFLSQEARYICVNRATVNELRKLLRELAKREIGE